jgi:hypothetical protein
MSIFTDLIEKIMEVFMDDFTVYGRNFDDCLANKTHICVSAISFFCPLDVLQRFSFMDLSHYQ